MPETGFKLYGYRWIVLLVFMLIIAMTQVLWLNFAPITSTAASFYHVTDLDIGLFSMIFLIVYIFVSIPASWVIDTYGFRVGVGIGAALTGIFALLRGLWAHDYNMVLLAEIGIAVGQPFVTNATTKVAARWFPINERATASGLGMMGLYAGIIISMLMTPALTASYGMVKMLWIFGVAAMVAAVAFIVLAKERPPTAPCPPEQEARTKVFQGMKQVFKKRDFILVLVAFLFVIGIFNGVQTWIENIVKPRGFNSSQAGLLGGMMVIGGIVGSFILPALSDKLRKRKPFLILACLGAAPGLIGMGYFTSYPLLLISGFECGFFLLVVGSIGFQYAAEVTYPAPESVSNGLLFQFGQISGIIAIYAMDMFKAPGTGSMAGGVLVSAILLIVCGLICMGVKESKLIQGTQGMAEAAASSTKNG